MVSFSLRGRTTGWLASLLLLTLWIGCQGSTPAVDDDAVASMPNYDTNTMAQSIHERVNSEREAAGLSSLAWSEELAALSRAHSQDMVQRDFFDHVNPDGQSPTERGQAMDVSCTTIVEGRRAGGIAENIYDASAYHTRRTTTQGDETSVTYDWKTANGLSETVVQGWMGSSGHRRNILNDTYEAQGLGVAVSDDLRVLVTQTFC
ncbi:hypothetical protein CRI93_13110 [Longimonas halophila]|uniref:SCP domain-containing protein n=1 Tax=Longimonas halophila TaxID=1469170 RepID=A0A2H3NQH1_9BACT|nr:hypothetical protein CRI93_13110 [Longimonas halophila]